MPHRTSSQREADDLKSLLAETMTLREDIATRSAAMLAEWAASGDAAVNLPII